MIGMIAGRLKWMRTAVFHRLFPAAALQRALRRTKEHELELNLLPVLCDPSRVSIDVGANAGVYTAALMSLSSHVIAVEPHPRLARIVGTLPADKVTVRRAIASHTSDREEYLEVDVVEQQEADALGHIGSGPKRPGTRRFAVRTITLDDLAERGVGFVKIDVEGHELEVLAGSKRLIATHRPNFLIEAEARHRKGAPDDIFAFFDREDYDGFFVRRGAMHGVSTFDLSMQNEANLLSYRTRQTADYVNNFIFLPRQSDQAGIKLACDAILARMSDC